MAGWLIVLALFLLLSSASVAWTRWNRSRAVRLEPGEKAVATLKGIPTRIFVSHALPGGIRPNRMIRSAANLVLSENRMLVGIGMGRVLEAAVGAKGRATCTGPRRMVIETTWAREPQPVFVRLEMVVDQAEEWAQRIQAFLKAG
jgi:hypothetical protein